MKKKYQVFISSTFKDVKDERQAIAKAVIDMGFIPSGMESFPATSSEQLRYIQRVIDDCDYYVLVVGGRYGSTTSEGVSFTEAEYDYAVSKNKTVLAFIHENPDAFPVGVTDGDAVLRQKLSDFRQKASTGRVVKFWSSKDELALHAMTSLHHAAEDYPGIGWVRGDFQESPEVNTELRLIAAAAAVAAHECGHAVQHATAYSWLQMRSKLVPVVNVSSRIMQWVILGGLLLANSFGNGLLFAGIIMFAVTTLFAFITLPVEYDASNRALAWMKQRGIVTTAEYAMSEDALKWAARTYVVAAIGSLATLLYYIALYMGRRD